MALKPVRFIYQSRISSLGVATTGLTNVKAQIYIDGVAKYVGNNALTLTELDATNAKGLYECSISVTQLTTLGALAGQNLEAFIDSATATAPAVFKTILTAFNTDDIDAHLSTQDTAIAGVKSDTAAIKSDLETGSSSLAAIKAAIVAIQNNAGFAVPIAESFIKPVSGTANFRIPITIYNETNGLVDPDSNSIIVTLVNQAGADRSSYLVGYTAGNPGSAPAVRDSMGQYHIDVTIPSTAAQEEIIFTFSYAVGGSATARKATTDVVTDIQSQGFALQTTLVATQTTVNNTNAAVNDASTGLVAAQTTNLAIKAQTDKIGDATIGLSALKTAANQIYSEVVNNVEGTGFNVTTDSLHAISQMLQIGLYSGGKAV